MVQPDAGSMIFAIFQVDLACNLPPHICCSRTASCRTSWIEVSAAKTGRPCESLPVLAALLQVTWGGVFFADTMFGLTLQGHQVKPSMFESVRTVSESGDVAAKKKQLSFRAAGRVLLSTKQIYYCLHHAPPLSLIACPL